jgi:histidinol-phosphate/aromatic aminotransferase/cobyric acid decarboxylase-like protein
MTGYIPGEQPKDGLYTKLNTNENPYAPSPKVLAALKDVYWRQGKGRRCLQDKTGKGHGWQWV